MPVKVTPVDRVSSWEAHIRGMEREWGEILVRQASVLLADWRVAIRAMDREWGEISVRRTRALLAEWHEAMSEMRRQHNRLVSDGLWLTGPSDFLDIIGLARHENTHSRMLEWLLKPTARHGLGCGVVRRLLEHCTEEPVPAPLAVRRVAFSQWRNNREADLVVWSENFTLVIENKVDATEQPHQCDDLYENFKNENGPLFLFLTPDGRKPSTATAPGAQRAFRTLAWPELRAMLETALNESRPADGVATAVDVVRNYLRTLKEQFG